MIVSTSGTSSSSPYFYYSTFFKLSPFAFVYSLLSNLFVKLQPVPVFEIPSNRLPQPRKRVAIVTGSNTGVGFETAKSLAEDHGFEVILACRSREKGLQAASKIPNGKAVFVAPLDLSSFKSIKDFCRAIQDKYDSIDVLVNNAGTNGNGKSCDNLDLCFQSNTLGHFLLTTSLLPQLKGGGRIVNLASVMHHFCGDRPIDEDYWKTHALYQKKPPTGVYAASKLASVFFSLELNRRYGKSHQIRAIAVNPGAVNSDIWRNYPTLLKIIFQLIFLDTRQGSSTSVAAAVGEFDHDAVYLQPYSLSSYERTPFPLFEMMGPHVGYRVTPPRLPDHEPKVSSAMWKVFEELTSKA